MARTTIDIDDPVLAELKAHAAEQRVSLGSAASALLARALKSERTQTPPRTEFILPTFNAGMPRVDLTDREALREALADERHP